MINVKPIYFFLLLTTLLFLPTNLHATTPASELIYFEDSLVELDVSPLLKNGVLYTRLRDIADLLNLEVSYDIHSMLATVSTSTDRFTYNLQTGQSFFNDAPLFDSTPCFIKDNYTWVPTQVFAQLFGFQAVPNTELLFSTVIGEEQLVLDYLPDPITVPIYDYTSVYTLLINKPTPPDAFNNATFNAYIHTVSVENGIVELSLSPYTDISIPDTYELMGSQYLIHISSDYLSFKVAPHANYTYFVYEPKTFSTETQANSLALLEPIASSELLLAEITVTDGIITDMTQIYIP